MSDPVQSYVNQLKELRESTYRVYDYPGDTAMKTAFECACKQVGYQCQPISTTTERALPPGSYNWKSDFSVTTFSIKK